MSEDGIVLAAETDEILVEKIQRGQTKHFAEILERYQAKLTRYARKFLADPKDAEDVVQEVFIKAYRNIQSFDVARKFSSWLYRVAHNECINFLRKKKIESLPLLDLDTLFPHISREEHQDELNVQEIKNQIETSLKNLDLKYREPLVLYYLEGFDYKEIADILRIPMATVGIRLSRGRKLLKDDYERLNLGN